MMKKEMIFLSRISRKQKVIICAILVSLQGLLLVCCVLLYQSWQTWKKTNEEVRSYAAYVCKEDRHSKIWLQQSLKYAAQEVMETVQRKAARQGVQIVSFQAASRSEYTYEVEAQGYYGAFILFLTDLENEEAPVHAEVVRITKEKGPLIFHIIVAL